MINSDKLIGCTKEIITLADVLDSFAKQKGTELIISSGKRSVESNQQVGGSSSSWHLTGNAIDCYLKDRHVFKDVTELYLLVSKQDGAFNNVIEFEVCRDKKGTQHFHFAIVKNINTIKYFTGIYK